MYTFAFLSYVMTRLNVRGSEVCAVRPEINGRLNFDSEVISELRRTRKSSVTLFSLQVCLLTKPRIQYHARLSSYRKCCNVVANRKIR